MYVYEYIRLLSNHMNAQGFKSTRIYITCNFAAVNCCKTGLLAFACEFSYTCAHIYT